MNINKVFSGKYLSAADLDQDTDVTIIGEGEAEVTNEGVKTTKPCIYFKEFEKGMILNPTNAKVIAQVLGTPETEEWVGGRVTLYVATVDAFGKQTEAIRVKLRAPKALAATAQRQGQQPIRGNVNTGRPMPPAQQYQDDDEAPF